MTWRPTWQPSAPQAPASAPRCRTGTAAAPSWLVRSGAIRGADPGTFIEMSPVGQRGRSAPQRAGPADGLTTIAHPAPVVSPPLTPCPCRGAGAAAEAAGAGGGAGAAAALGGDGPGSCPALPRPCPRRAPPLSPPALLPCHRGREPRHHGRPGPAPPHTPPVRPPGACRWQRWEMRVWGCSLRSLLMTSVAYSLFSAMPL